MAAATQLYWQEAPSPAFGRHDGPRTVDMTVIGGGITGLMTADLLRKEGRRSSCWRRTASVPANRLT